MWGLDREDCRGSVISGLVDPGVHFHDLRAAIRSVMLPPMRVEFQQPVANCQRSWWCHSKSRWFFEP